MKDQLELLRALMRLEPKVHIFGGVAEDALLAGRFTRPHEDVDVLVVRDDLDLRLDQAEAWGFRRWHVRMRTRDGEPLVIGAIEGGVNLELVVFDRDEDGTLYFDVPVEEGMRRFWLPPGALDHAPSTIEGVEVRTVSPLALYQIRAAVADTFGGFRPKDRVAQEKLRERFFRGVPEEKLAGRIALVERWASEGTAAPASP